MTASSKRVLFLAHALNLSGVSRHTMLLAQGLQSRGWTIGVVARDLTPGTPMGREWFEAAGIETFQAPFPGYGLTIHNGAAAARTIATLSRIAGNFGAGLIHVHAPTLCPYAGIVGWNRGIPTVSTLHLESLGPNKTRLARLGNRLFPKAFGEYSIGISTDMSRLLIDCLGIPPDRVQTVLHGVEDDRFHAPSSDERSQARGHFGLTDADRVVCMIAVLEERKGHALLVKALSDLRRRGIDIIALCAGHGSDANRQRIEQQARDAGVGDLIRLIGYQDSRQVMWASDASLLLSAREGFGLGIVESMLCGLVPLRTPGAGASDQIINGQNGFVIPFGDQRALAQALELLFSQPDLRRRMGSEAEQFARARFTRRAMAEGTERVYEDAVQRRARDKVQF